MNKEKSDTQIIADASSKLIADVAAEKKINEEQKKLNEELELLNKGEAHALVDDKISKAELAEIIAVQNKKMEDLKTVLLRAKAQGKGHIEAPEEENDDEIIKIYGKNSMVARALAKNR